MQVLCAQFKSNVWFLQDGGWWWSRGEVRRRPKDQQTSRADDEHGEARTAPDADGDAPAPG